MVRESVMSAINTCYRTVSGQQSCPKGEVVFIVVIGPDGQVTKGSMQRGQSGYKDFERCMKRLKAGQKAWSPRSPLS